MKRTDMDNHSRYSRKWKNSLTAGVLLALALGGTVALAAAKQLTLSPDSDGKLNYAVDGELAQAKALNSGRI